MRRPVVITGGGTGGHVFPMQAIAEALVARGVEARDLRFVGSRRGPERRLLGDRGIPVTALPGRGLRRSWRAGDLAANVGAVLGLLVATVRGTALVGRWRPRAVVSVGGYAAFAMCAAAALWRAPLVLVDADAVPGAVHRTFARVAARRCVAFGPGGAGVVVTGTPLRAAIEDLDRSDVARAQARTAARPPIDADRLVVVVMTGSLGARRVNDAVGDLAGRWAERPDVTLIHVTGERDYERALERRPLRGALDYRVVAFADMAALWVVADLAVCRAGAVTVAELTRLAIPSILVPLPGAPGAHQSRNAEVLARGGAARVIDDAACTAVSLAGAIDELSAPGVRLEMARAARGLARPGAASAIAAVIEEAAR